jgi:hypothetical protein
VLLVSLSGNYAWLIGILLRGSSKNRIAYIFMLAKDNSEDGDTIPKYKKHDVIAQKTVIFKNKFLKLSY